MELAVRACLLSGTPDIQSSRGYNMELRLLGRLRFACFLWHGFSFALRCGGYWWIWNVSLGRWEIHARVSLVVACNGDGGSSGYLCVLHRLHSSRSEIRYGNPISGLSVHGDLCERNVLRIERGKARPLSSLKSNLGSG
jgi:hypothetical protein